MLFTLFAREAIEYLRLDSTLPTVCVRPVWVGLGVLEKTTAVRESYRLSGVVDGQTGLSVGAVSEDAGYAD